jgi:hypothetical protein
LISVNRNPLEKVSFEETTTQVAEVDVLAAVFQKLSDPLKALSTRSRLITSPGPPVVRSFSPTAGGGVVTCSANLTDLCGRVDEVRTKQATVHQSLVDWKRNADSVPARLEAPAFSKWNYPGTTTFDNVVSDATRDLLDFFGCELPSPGIGIDCRTHTHPVPKCGSNNPIVACETHSSTLEETAAELAYVREVISSLYAPNDSTYIYLSKEFNAAVVDQGNLERQLSKQEEAQAGLRAIRDQIRTLDKALDFAAKFEKQFPAKTVSSSSQIKVSAVQVVTKKATSLSTVTLNWSSLPIEVSLGFWYSALDKRSYSSVPVLENGEPVVVEGVAQKILGVTKSSPNIVPGIFVHYRYKEWPLKSRRFAILASFGVGFANSAVEFAAGPSFSFGNFMVSPLIHYGRDLVLTDGLQVGDPNPPDLTAFQKRKWTARFAVGFTYKVPL